MVVEAGVLGVWGQGMGQWGWGSGVGGSGVRASRVWGLGTEILGIRLIYWLIHMVKISSK